MTNETLRELKREYNSDWANIIKFVEAFLKESMDPKDSEFVIRCYVNVYKSAIGGALIAKANMELLYDYMVERWGRPKVSEMMDSVVDELKDIQKTKKHD